MNLLYRLADIWGREKSTFSLWPRYGTFLWFSISGSPSDVRKHNYQRPVPFCITFVIVEVAHEKDFSAAV